MTALDHFVLAVEQERGRRYSEAITQCEKALERQPGYLAAEYLLGLCQLKMNRWADAHASMTLCLKQRPDLFWPWVQRGEARVMLKSYKDAEADLGKAIEKARTPLERYVTFMARALHPGHCAADSAAPARSMSV